MGVHLKQDLHLEQVVSSVKPWSYLYNGTGQMSRPLYKQLEEQRSFATSVSPGTGLLEQTQRWGLLVVQLLCQVQGQCVLRHQRLIH